MATRFTSLGSIVGYVSIFLLLVAGYQWNSWNAADDSWFERHSKVDFYVLGKLVRANETGRFAADGLFMGYYVPFPNAEHPFDQHFRFYETGETPPDSLQYVTYLSQSGIQSLLFYTIEKMTGLRGGSSYFLFQLFTSSLLAITIVFFLILMRDLVGWRPIIILSFLLLYSPWLVGFGRNLYFQIWSFFAPFVLLSWYLFVEYKKNFKASYGKLFMRSAIYYLIPCMFMGFAFVTTTALMMVIPVIFFGLLSQLKFREIATRVIAVGMGAGVAIFSSLCILVIQIALVKGKLSIGIHHIWNSFLKRSNANVENIHPSHVNQNIIDAMDASITQVIASYLQGISLDLSFLMQKIHEGLMLKVSFFHVLLFLTVASVVLFGLKLIGRRKTRQIDVFQTIIITSWISLLCPVSWFVFFKAHSYLHWHTDFIVWFMPFVLMVYLAAAVLCNRLITYAGSIVNNLLRQENKGQHS